MTTAAASKTKAKATPKAEKPKETTRDFVEQIVVAFILALLVRGFAAEAFVIPTGSMAPTLMGRHKEITCRQCGQVYQVNASEDAEAALFAGGNAPSGEAGTCSNCWYRDEDLAETPSFKGDRILVMKFLYDLPILSGIAGPNRWDIVVFHYPEEPEVNFIKRCVGLPGDELRIWYGDVLVRKLGTDAPFGLARRPLKHQQAMQMPVWDDAHRPRAFKDRPEWRRWTSPVFAEPTPGTFELKAPAPTGWDELRYRNLVPDPAQWQAAMGGGKSPLGKPRATLITDFYAYNTAEALYPGAHPERAGWLQPHWVGDLTLSARVAVGSKSGAVRLELVEGGVAYRCEIDVATGMATLFEGDQPVGTPAQTRLVGPGTYDLGFANVDDRLTLWVDGRTPFGEGFAYADGNRPHPAPTAKDLAPAAVALRGTSGSVTGLALKRDIYYTLSPSSHDLGGSPWEGDQSGRLNVEDPTRRVVEVFDRLGDPSRFAEFGNLRSKDFAVTLGHYMMLGDNSPRSKDGRGWDQHDKYGYHDRRLGDVEPWAEAERAAHEVPAALIVGKAFFVYWPHGKPFGPDIRLNRDIRIPFRPYLERMKWIR